MVDPSDFFAYKEEAVGRLFGPDNATAGAFGAQVGPEAGPLARRIPMAGNILGVGLGAKITDGSVSADTALRVYVRTKIARRDLGSNLVPDEIGGLPTDVVAVGDVRAFARPVRCGASIGHRDVTAGTLGCLVHLGGGVEPHILSNNHVLANVNRAKIGDQIVEPGPADGGTEPIAELTDFESIVAGGGPNAFDAAVARVLDPGDVLPAIEMIGSAVNPPVEAALYQSVRKNGRSSRHTVGVVMDLSADLWVRVLPQANAWFTEQIAVVGVGGVFSQPGDSGALVVDAVRRSPVGLLFAGGGDHTFVNPIDPVLTRFGATIIEAQAPA